MEKRKLNAELASHLHTGYATNKISQMRPILMEHVWRVHFNVKVAGYPKHNVACG